jgi:hypothetical protein
MLCGGLLHVGLVLDRGRLWILMIVIVARFMKTVKRLLVRAELHTSFLKTRCSFKHVHFSAIVKTSVFLCFEIV